ncbi:MAG: DUF1127 domain-containing protein [Alphaproteobacteria bacterium]|jgi:uncharacterized protein YjiS (DUF1127 family)|nr:DUF1127 domain-containing protein [Alphaproteobacteria bacterium]MBT4086003.1 DUF1127 domain-containing protein [Alphaproteobacteria bacterium]MBT4546553.1 DUF1127 domain-containing protein [Alphaproteobacteria bacterium]MBT7745968.1 DUF1127 domain-containing protein [Alphaproteobacteria bacterium]
MNWIDTIHSRPIGKSSRLTAVTMVPKTNTILNAPKRVIKSVIHGLMNWHYDRMECEILRGMNEHTLKDVGITRGQADQMARDRWVHRDIRKFR